MTTLSSEVLSAYFQKNCCLLLQGTKGTKEKWTITKPLKHSRVLESKTWWKLKKGEKSLFQSLEIIQLLLALLWFLLVKFKSIFH